jgi:hypothetical protein
MGGNCKELFGKSFFEKEGFIAFAISSFLLSPLPHWGGYKDEQFQCVVVGNPSEISYSLSPRRGERVGGQNNRTQSPNRTLLGFWGI